MKLKAFVVEDIDVVRRSFIKLLDKSFSEMEVIGVANGVLNALKQLKTLKPDILFLDIDLPDGTAFDILDCLDHLDYRIIFTTASNHYAIKAFQVSAIDYLLKPIDHELLVSAIQKAMKHLPVSATQIDLVKKSMAGKEYSSQIALSTSEKIALIDVKNIVRCEASSNYTTFYFVNGKKEMVAKTLKEYEKILDPTLFLRTHQSHLVNFGFVKEFVKKDGGYLLLENGEMISVSVRKRAKVMEFMT